jgi:protein-disulfide isomerase
MARFEADFKAAAAVVKADMAEGEASHVHGTPTIFINGVEYSGPMHPDYLALWIQEELAVNR